MNKSIVVGLAILTASTSAASALTQRTHHSRAMKPNASTAAMKPNPSARTNAFAAMGAPSAVAPGESSKNQGMHMKNLRDSGYDPKKDFTSSGIMRDH